MSWPTSFAITHSIITVGNYEIIQTLGQGATATVYQVRYQPTGEFFALKVFHPGIWAHEEARRRAAAEFLTASRFTHPHIVAVKESLLESSQPAVVMEYVEGQSLEHFQSRLPYVLPELAVSMMVDVLDALDYAHSQGVVHRDLKPANILVSSQGQVFVTDFGHSKILDASAATLTGTVLGSPDYMSPEQAQGLPVTPASDVFSAASVLYFLVTGTRPFHRGTPLATLAQVVTAHFEAPHKRNPKVSADLSRLLARGLARRPEDRFASAGEFRQALLRYLELLGWRAEAFALPVWMKNPPAVTLAALEQIAQTLMYACERELRQGCTDHIYEKLTHLSTVAPESPRLIELMELADRSRRRRERARRWKPLLWSGGLVLMMAMGVYLALTRRSSDEMPNPVELASPPEVTPPLSTPQVEKPFNMPALPKKNAKAEQPSRPLKIPSAYWVHFDVPQEVRVLWNGRLVDAQQSLRVDHPGVYRLRLEKPGSQPIEQNVQVKSNEPTYIRVR